MFAIKAEGVGRLFNGLHHESCCHRHVSLLHSFRRRCIRRRSCCVMTSHCYMSCATMSRCCSCCAMMKRKRMSCAKSCYMSCCAAAYSATSGCFASHDKPFRASLTKRLTARPGGCAMNCLSRLWLCCAMNLLPLRHDLLCPVLSHDLPSRVCDLRCCHPGWLLPNRVSHHRCCHIHCRCWASGRLSSDPMRVRPPSVRVDRCGVSHHFRRCHASRSSGCRDVSCSLDGDDAANSGDGGVPNRDYRDYCSSAHSSGSMGGSDLPSPTIDLHHNFHSRCSNSNHTTCSAGSPTKSYTRGRSCSSRSTTASRLQLLRWLRPRCRTSR